MKVLELMKVHVIKAGMDATLGDAVDLMDLYQITVLPIVDEEDRPVGIVSESDIVSWLLGEAGAESANPVTAPLNRVERLQGRWTSPVVAVDEGTDVWEAARVMVKHGFQRLPVTGDGRLVGTVSRIDVCQALLEGELTQAE
jgi:CBS domain-containing protein